MSASLGRRRSVGLLDFRTKKKKKKKMAKSLALLIVGVGVPSL